MSKRRLHYRGELGILCGRYADYRWTTLDPAEVTCLDCQKLGLRRDQRRYEFAKLQLERWKDHND